MGSQQVFQRLIDAELTAAISFCRAAETSQDRSRIASNMEQAERACQAALDFTARAHLPPALQDVIQRKIDYVRRLLSENRKRRMVFKLESADGPSNKRSAA
ncbi:MAG TPA: hypothetical protein VMF66_03485 [Candidatus Acidoferrum sp.]|nr:hypothetical protein [Candidatus Acidoferrum sp.]